MKGLHLEEKVNMSICIHSEIWKKKKKPATIWWLSTDWATKENEIMKWTNEMKQQMKVKEYYSCSVN